MLDKKLKYLFAFIMISSTALTLKAQPFQSGIYSCSLDKIDSFPDAYYLVLCEDSIYYFYLSIGLSDHIVHEQISEGKYFKKNDTLLLVDKFLESDFKLLHRGDKLYPIKFFEVFNGSVLNLKKNLTPNECVDYSIADNKSANKLPQIIHNVNNIYGCYINILNPEIIKKDGMLFANYTYKISINSDETFDYWIYDNLFLKGKWKLKNGELQLFDSIINTNFTLYFDKRGDIIPLRFPGNIHKKELFILYKQKDNVMLYKPEVNTPILIPDE